MAAPRSTAARTLEWAERNIGTGPNRVRRWTRQAGFASFEQWCGIFLGSALRAQGIKPPKGYAAAANWSSYGTAVGRSEIEPGDIIVYGDKHVAMATSATEMIQGNDADGTVGTSTIASQVDGSPITAIRRPPYRNLGKEAEIREHEDLGEGGLGLPFEGTFEKHVGEPVNHAIDSAAELTGTLLHALEDPEGFLLTATLLGGGAFLVYYGAARSLGVHRPVATPLETTAKVASAA